jgi:hypothetical protein
MILVINKKIVTPENIFIDNIVERVDSVHEVDIIENRIMTMYRRIFPSIDKSDILISINYVQIEEKEKEIQKQSYLPILYENKRYSEHSL